MPAHLAHARRILAIPARRRSTRLPDKMLLRATGKTVLQHTYEYRHPTPQQVSKAAAEAASVAETGDGKVKVDMISRYLGLVVVPGKYIVQIQLDEFVSQMRGRRQVVGMGIGGLGGGEGVGGLVV